MSGIAGCCARAASGHAAAAPPTAASNSRRPMVTVIRPSRARCVRERYHATSLLSLTAPHPAGRSAVRQALAPGVTGYRHMGTLPPLRYTFDDGLNAISRQTASTAQTQLRTACLADRDNRAAQVRRQQPPARHRSTTIQRQANIASRNDRWLARNPRSSIVGCSTKGRNPR